MLRSKEGDAKLDTDRLAGCGLRSTKLTDRPTMNIVTDNGIGQYACYWFRCSGPLLYSPKLRPK